MSVLSYSLSTILNLHLPPFTSAVTTAAAVAVVAAAQQQLFHPFGFVTPVQTSLHDGSLVINRVTMQYCAGAGRFSPRLLQRSCQLLPTSHPRSLLYLPARAMSTANDTTSQPQEQQQQQHADPVPQQQPQPIHIIVNIRHVPQEEFAAQAAASAAAAAAAAAATQQANSSSDGVKKKVKRNVALHVGYVGTSYTGGGAASMMLCQQKAA